MTPQPFRRILCLATTAAFCLVAITQLPLEWPPFFDPHRLAAFVTDVGAIGAAIAVLATLAGCGAAYVLVVSLVAAIATVSRPHGVCVRLARVITVPALKWALPGAVGLTILIAPVGTAGASTPHDDDTIVMLADEPAEFRLIGPTTTTRAAAMTSLQATEQPTTSTLPVSSTRRDTTTRQASSSHPPTTGIPTTTAVPSATSPSTPAVTASPMAKPAVPVRVPARNPAHTKPTRTWTVEPGDHLWHIAQATLAADLGHSPTDIETFGYWRRLIDANRSHLVDPNNPDLILPGQQLDVPARAG